MDPFSIMVIGGIVVSVIAATTFFSTKYTVRQNLRNENRVSIRDFNHGEIGKIVGQVSQYKEILESPFSGRKCVFYQIYVQQKDDDYWKTIISEQKCVDFLMTEGIGIALIDAKHIKGFLDKDIEKRSGFLNDPTFQLNKYLHRHNKKSRTLFGMNKTMRFYEGIVHIGETVAVKGTGEWELKPDPTEQKLIMKGNIVSDIPNTFN